MKKFLLSLPGKLVLAVIIGIILGLFANEPIMRIIVTISYFIGQLIQFSIPLLIIGFITPSITKLERQASKMLGIAIALAYLSSIGAAILAALSGYIIIPNMSIHGTDGMSKALPEVPFKLEIPPIMPVTSALVLAIIIGLAITWSKASVFQKICDEFIDMVINIISKIIIPLLPLYIASNFACMSYRGIITKQIPLFIGILLIAMLGHIIWTAFLYTIAGVYSGKNPIFVVKHYLEVYLTAIGTMSSAATLPVALKCARKSQILRKDIIDFGIPIFSNIHLCGSVMSEVFFVMAVSKILYGHLPKPGVMLIFIMLLGIIAVGAPGVPGGTAMSSLGLLTEILGFCSTGTALLITIYSLQDSFATGCNITGDGALTLMLTGYADKNKL